MEFKTEEYKRRGSNVFTSADGSKYVQSKTIENGVYLKCAIFRNGCKGTAKLNLTRHLITPMHLHNHEVSEYKAGVYQLKAKCKTLAKQTQSPSLRSIFDDATRNEPNTHDVSFPECESAMYRSRKRINLKSLQQPLSSLTCYELHLLESTSNFLLPMGTKSQLSFFLTKYKPNW